MFGFWFIISRFLRFWCGNRCFCGLIQLLGGNLRFLWFEGGFDFSVPFWIMGRSFDTVSTLGFCWIGPTVLKFTRSKHWESERERERQESLEGKERGKKEVIFVVVLMIWCEVNAFTVLFLLPLFMWICLNAEKLNFCRCYFSTARLIFSSFYST